MAQVKTHTVRQRNGKRYFMQMETIFEQKQLKVLDFKSKTEIREKEGHYQNKRKKTQINKIRDETETPQLI
jgi:predicted DNA-binding protein with PD1-like motif